MSPEEPVEVYTAGTMAEAQFVHDLLMEAGVKSEIVGESQVAGLGEVLNVDASPRIWVRAQDEVQARHVIQAYQQRLIDRVEGEATQPLQKEPFCYFCGQEIQQGESPCPSCGKTLDWSPAE